MDNFSNLLSDTSRLLHTDQVFLKTPNNSVLTTVNGENGHNAREINEPIENFKVIYERLNSQLLKLKLPDKQTCFEKITLLSNTFKSDEPDENEIACAVSLIPGQLGLIEEINTMCAGNPKYECDDFLKSLNSDTCKESCCIGSEMVSLTEKSIDIPVFHQPFIYYPLIRKIKHESIDVRKYLNKLINYASLYKDLKIENITLKCALCTLFTRNNLDLIIGKSDDPFSMVKYLNRKFVDFYTPLESVSIHRNNLFSKIEICLKGDIWICKIKQGGGIITEYS